MTDNLPTIDPRNTALLVMDFQAMPLGVISEAEALLSQFDPRLLVRRSCVYRRS
jgi:hypothetical protein